jgi:hypothetical protein
MPRMKDAALEFLADKHVTVAGVSRTAASHGANVVYQRLRQRGNQVFAVNPNAEGQTWWALVREPVDEASTRLVTRSRGAIDRPALGLMLSVFRHPLDFGMQPRQLLNAKRLVETG